MGKTTTPKPSSLSIGALSKYTDCNIETIRYYERIGMLLSNAKLSELQRLERVLKQMASPCPGDDGADCPVIEALFGGNSKALVAARF